MSWVYAIYRDASARNDGVTIDDAVTFFVDALQDPWEPRWCGPCLVGCMLVIQPGPDNVESHLRQYHNFWSTAIAFLTAKRTLPELNALEERWGFCTCGSNTESVVAAKLHYIAGVFNWSKSSGGQGGLGLLIDHLALMFTVTVESVKTVSIAKGRHPDVWPASPTDLMPYGAKVTVDSIVTMSRFIGDSTVLSLLPFYMRICRSLIIPAIASSAALATHWVERGLELCDSVSKAPPTPNGLIHPGAASEFMRHMAMATPFVSSLCSSLPIHLTTFHDGHELGAFSFASQAVSIMESQRLPSEIALLITHFREPFAGYAAILYISYPRLSRTLPLAELHPAIATAVHGIQRDTLDPVLSVWDLMRHARKNQMCFALACAESLQTAGATYRRCSGCRIVSYSSRACQRRAWSDARAPHREICKTLRRVYDAGGGHLEREEDKDKFVGGVRGAGIPREELMAIGGWISNMTSMMSTEDGSPAPGTCRYDKKGNRI